MAGSLVRRARNLSKYVLGLDEPELGQSPRQLIDTRDQVKLWRYSNDDRSVRPPLLLVMSLVTRPTVFDLQPGNSLIERFCDEGFDVWMIDWGEPGPADAENTLETYCLDYIPWAIERTVAGADADSVTLFGYCFGGFLSVLSVAANPDLPIRNLAVLATPIAPERGPQQLQPDRITARFDETGNVPAETLRTAFMALDPVDSSMTVYLNLWQRLDDDEYLLAHRVMTGWGNDHIRFPGATARQMAKAFGGDNPLIAGQFELGGERVDLGAITMPFLSVVGERDHIAPPVTSAPLMDLVGSDDATELRVPAGHVGLFVGKSAAKHCIPQMIDWISERSSNSRR